MLSSKSENFAISSLVKTCLGCASGIAKVFLSVGVTGTASVHLVYILK
jgi:hypothetical protein